MMRHFGIAWDSVLIFVYLVFLAIVTTLYMLLYTLEQVLRVRNWDAPIEPKKEYINHPINLNTFQLSTPQVKYDVERMFCKALLEFPNLTESYWLKGSPSKWQSLGGVGRSDFVKCKDRLTRLGALERTNPQATNSPHRIADRRILEHRASRPTPPN